MNAPFIPFGNYAELSAVIAPFSATRGVRQLVVQFNDYMAFSPEMPSRDDQVDRIDHLVAEFLAGMTQRKMLEELVVLTQGDSCSSVALTVEDPTPSSFWPGGWTIRERVADILADVYRALMIKVVDASVTAEPEASAST